MQSYTRRSIIRLIAYSIKKLYVLKMEVFDNVVIVTIMLRVNRHF